MLIRTITMTSPSVGGGMKRRATAGSKASDKKRTKPKRRIVAAAYHARPYDADLQKQLDQAIAELAKARKLLADERELLAESLEQQTVTSEVLKVISSSPGDLHPVFATILENATRLCEASYGMLFRCGGARFHFEAAYNIPPALEEHQRQRGWFQSKAVL